MCSTCIPAVFADGSSSSPPRPSRSATSRSRFLASAPTSRGYPGTRPSGGRLGDRRDDYRHHPLRSAPVPSDGGLGRQVPLRADGVSNGAEKRGARSVSPVAATEAPRRADRNRTAEGGSCPDRIATALSSGKRQVAAADRRCRLVRRSPRRPRICSMGARPICSIRALVE